MTDRTKVVKHVALPITASKRDKRTFHRVECLRAMRGGVPRTQLLRDLIDEEWESMSPARRRVAERALRLLS